MTTKQTGIRLPELTQRQLTTLCEWSGMNQSSVMVTAIDRMYREEIENMNASEKIERGCEVNYGSGYTASAGKHRNIDGEIRYGISYQQGEMPAFSRKEFATEAELISEMRTVAPLSKWRLTEYES